MGTIIGDGITFDDVLLVPQYSEVTPNMIDLTTHLTQKGCPEYPYDECRNGYCHRTQNGNRHGKTGWNRYHPQEYVHTGSGRRS